MRTLDFLTRRVTHLSAIAVLALIGACAGPPVQEMSDARQAISAAQEAGAESAASETFQEARQLLSEAEKALYERLYYAARTAAIGAKTKAVEALRASESDGDGGQDKP